MVSVLISLSPPSSLLIFSTVRLPQLLLFNLLLGLTFKEGARVDCAAAVAIVLFGNSDTILPGGYVGQETSPDSPIAQVAEFPSEFILLGRATVMIKVGGDGDDEDDEYSYCL